MASIHRFRDSVAVWLGDGNTLYMTPRDARRLAKAINAAARDVIQKPFADSTVGTVEMPGVAHVAAHNVPKINRA